LTLQWHYTATDWVKTAPKRDTVALRKNLGDLVGGGTVFTCLYKWHL